MRLEIICLPETGNWLMIVLRYKTDFHPRAVSTKHFFTFLKKA